MRSRASRIRSRTSARRTTTAWRPSRASPISRQPLQNEADLEKTEKGRAQIEEHEKTRVEAAAALLHRFKFVIDPTITDAEEKQVAFEGIQGVGKNVLEPLRAFVEKHQNESISWPIKILKSAYADDEDALVTELLAWLSKWDTEYAKFVDAKVQLLVELEEHKDARILEATKDFLLDVNETSRYHAVGCALAQNDEAAIAPLVDMFIDEESLRIRNRVCEGFIPRGWSVPEEQTPRHAQIPPVGILDRRRRKDSPQELSAILVG